MNKNYIDNQLDKKLEKVKEIVSQQQISDIDKYKQIMSTLFEKTSKKPYVLDWQIQWMKELSRNYSYEEIARRLGFSISTVRFYLAEGEKEKVKLANEKNRKKMKENPVTWKKYMDYQREYQRELARKKRTLKVLNVAENENIKLAEDLLQ